MHSGEVRTSLSNSGVDPNSISHDETSLKYIESLGMRPGDFSNATLMIDLSKILETNDRARYCNLILFSLAIIMNSVGWLTFAPITRLMTKNYNLPLESIF